MPYKSAKFLNVDLEVKSARDLRPLAETFGDRVIAMYVGRAKRTYVAHFEIARYRKKETADVVIRDFCRLIEALPRPGRSAWKSAKRRTFDVGILAGLEPRSWGTTIQAETVQMAAKLGAEIAITVSAPREESS